MPIRGVLVAFEFLQGRLCVRSSLEHLDHSRGLISADVVAYDNVRALNSSFVKYSPLCSLKQKPYFESMRERHD